MPLAGAGDVGAGRTEAWWEDPRFTEGDQGEVAHGLDTSVSVKKQKNVAQV